ncbi:MAG: hypothetical protein L6V95_00005, partial [Candidatus Melainabacteria bacterium]
EDEAQQNLEKAQDAHKRLMMNACPGDLEEAIEYYITSVKLNPNVAKVIIVLLVCFMRMDKFHLKQPLRNVLWL